MYNSNMLNNISIITGVAVDSTYCGFNSTAITNDSFWSVTAGKSITIVFLDYHHEKMLPQLNALEVQ